MTKDEMTCYNCGNKNCNVYYSTVKKDYKRHFETYEYNDFDCVDHDKWEELKVEEIRTDNTKTLKNALERIEELEEENADLKEPVRKMNNVIIETSSNLTNAREIILKLYNAGRDVLMCRTEEKAYDNLSEAINDRSIEQFLKEIPE